MSADATPLKRGWQRLPPGLRPRDADQPGRGRLWRVETIVLLLAGLLLLIATVNDVVLSAHTNHRLVADLRTWRDYTGHNYKNVSAEQDIRKYTTTDVVCGNTTPGPPKERIQLCLQVTGPTVDGLRTARGGWYLPPKAENLHRYRYGCFGPPKRDGKCTR
ncbi:MAG: hypothetical protein QOG40_843 [Solirubrobacteraceae bacterium]|jgi:hypothetical protein|nr:hypothetical protein [Solirubrobacteraceae bacterium]